jgi:hypothetical protein
MSAPTTAKEARDAWSRIVYQSLTDNFDASKWTDLTVPSGACIETLKAGFFTVDFDVFTCLCTSDINCTFTPENYVSNVAFGY